MLFVIGIPVIIVVALFWVCFFKESFQEGPSQPSTFMDYFAFLLVSLPLAGGGAVFGSLFALIIGSYLPTQWNHYETSKLVLVPVKFVPVRKHHFLISDIYFFDEKGSVIVPGEFAKGVNFSIYEEKENSDGRGTLESFKLNFSDPRLKLFGIIVSDKKYEFHIPKGSLTKQFMIT